MDHLAHRKIDRLEAKIDMLSKQMGVILDGKKKEARKEKEALRGNVPPFDM